MDILNIQPIYFLFIGVAAVVVLVVADIVFGVLLFRFSKKLTLLFSGKKVKNLEDVFLNCLQKSKKQEADIADMADRINKLENISEKTFQKMGVVRFNPFNNIGGNQSFAIALLDSQNNGFVISSLFIKEANRVYAKSIKNGKSDYALSAEEQEAMNRAVDSNKKT